ncbi:TonB-dependent receptor [Xanthocytophaga agilis]|uniref:TonB-dependent receptor n=1 Tax=Xanthocytophaga agilis TaxID=3048010 RepID=A0AAE3R5Y0_9BACT|nr:TonB-dependent receptor [Xanthocytophaga agilis]MDJ1504246.1 TonB-dependent receptor [Xanthocytophaga agilis]
MKVIIIQTFIAALVSIVAFAHSGLAQGILERKVSLQMNQQTIKTILSKIEQQTNVHFVYSHQLIGAHRKISIKVADEQLVKVLEKLLTPLDISYELNGSRILLNPIGSVMDSSAFMDQASITEGTTDMLAQQITGKITSQQDGEPVVGATVLEKGTTNGTVTDIEGKYTLTLKGTEAVLIVSFIGFLSEETVVGNRSEVNVALVPDVKALEEIVVVGYGSQKKSVVTGAISSVKSSDLENMPVTRVEQSLQGRTSGLTITSSSGQPGAGSTVRIRGTTSINNSDPLYIVDGVQIGGGIDYLNQADIESIEVLKDAASASIYGARAANGVIIVTTKKGRSGQMEVNYNGYMGIQAPWRRLKLLNAEQYATLLNEATVAGGGQIRFQNPAQLGKGTDWQDAVFSNNAPIQNHELSLSAGSEKSTYFASFGYLSQDGIVAPSNSQYRRFTTRFNSTHKITKAVTFGSNIGYTRINSKGIDPNSEWGAPLNRAINIDPITPIIVTDPDVLNTSPYTDKPVVRDAQGRPYGISNIVTSEILNPIAALAVTQGRNWSDKIVGNAFLELEPIKGLKLRSSAGVDLAFWGDQSFSPVYYLNATNQNDVNDYNRGINRGLFWLWENTASYTRTFGKHNLTALVGTTAQRNYGETQGGTRTGLPVNNLNDASLGYPVPQTNQYFNGGEYQNTLASVFGRVIYNYEERYLFTGIIRRDGSSRFGPNNKYGTFPSVSVGWVASNERFWPTNNIVNFLKFRASYGITGNDNIQDFRYLATVGGGRNYTLGNGSSVTLINGVSPNAISNPDLKWEQTSQTDIGFDATLFGKVSFTFDMYHKKTTGMLLDIAVPWYAGNNGPVGNVADMVNKGYEIELGYSTNFGDVKFRINGNVSYLKNEVTYLGADKKYLQGQRFGPQQVEITRTEVGKPVGYLFGFKTDGLFQNTEDIASYVNSEGQMLQSNAKPGDIRFVDVNKDGKIDNDDRTMIGNPTPDWTFGLTASASWKGFDLMVFGQGVAGNDVFKGIRRFDLPTANWTTEALGRWTGEGTSNHFPRLTINDVNQNFSRSSDFFVENGSYFRIKVLQIGYSLPQAIVGKAGLKRVRIYITGNNLLTFTKYTGFDPEIGGGSMGVDRGIYPQARAFMVGLNLGL